MSIISSADTGDADLPEIANSIRLDGANDYLSRTPASASDQKKWTWSGWVKRSKLGHSEIFSAGNNASFFICSFEFLPDDCIIFYHNDGGTTEYRLKPSRVFRDVSAHFHVVLVCDVANATTADRVKIYINGTRETALLINDTFPNANLTVNSTAAHSIGRFNYDNTRYFDGYLSNICFIDGAAKTPSDFAYTDPNGQWRSLAGSALKALADAGGTNSFFLPFDNGSSTTTLGADASSKGNNWTLNNMVRDGSVSDCWSYDTPTNNFATLNPLYSGGTFSNGCLAYNPGSTQRTAESTIGFTSGKFYFEVDTVNSGALDRPWIGVAKTGHGNTQYVGQSAVSYGYCDTAQKSNNASASAYGTNFSAGGVVIGVAIDADAGTLTFYNNGVSQGTAYSSLSGEFFFAISNDRSGGFGYPFNVNFGQRPVSGGAFDSASGGYFRYTPPSGFKALCTKNLPTPTGAALEPKKHFDVVTRTGTDNGTNTISATISSLLFKPDLLWTKARSGATAQSHALFDSVRGAGSKLQSNTTSAETALTLDNTQAFNSNGFVTGKGDDTNGSGYVLVDWLWKAGGAAVTNNSGSISSQVSANTASGFSIVTWTIGSGNGTVGHGLGVAPKFYIVKAKNAVSNWSCWMYGFTSDEYLYMNTTGAKASSANAWGSLPTSTVIGTNGGVLFTTGNQVVAYCFAEVAGFSKIGSYTGTGTSDGSFVWCGFRPRFVMIKRTDAADNWLTVDSARDTYNTVVHHLLPNTSGAEDSLSGSIYHDIDFVSNGFKLRGTNALTNANGGTYVFIAFAEAPFKYSGAR